MMSSGLDLDSGSGNAKFVVLGAIVLAFGVGGYLALGHGSPSTEESKGVAAAVPVPVAPAPALAASSNTLAADGTASTQMGSTQTVAMNAATAEANLAASSVGAPTAAVTESPVAEDVQSGTRSEEHTS